MILDYSSGYYFARIVGLADSDRICAELLLAQHRQAIVVKFYSFKTS